MFRVILLLLFATYGINAETSYRILGYVIPLLTQCRDNGTIINHCIERAIENVAEKLSPGVTELDIPQYEPHYRYSQPYRHTYNEVFVGHMRLKHMKIHNISKFTANESEFESLPEDGARISFLVHYKKLVLTAKCLSNGTINDYYVNAQDDRLKMTVTDLDAKIVLEGHFYYPHDGERKYLKVDVVHVVSNQIKGSIKFRLETSQYLNCISDEETDYLDANGAAVWKQIEPDFRVGASTFIRTIANKVFDKYPVIELFIN